MKKLLIVSIVVGMLIGAGGCATIMNGSTDTVNISSRPPGAKFSIVSYTHRTKDINRMVVQTGTTPQNVTLQRKTEFWGNRYTVEFTKEGYVDKTVSMESSLSGWVWGNILFGGIIGVGIDGISGACENWHDVSVKLVPANKYNW